MPGSEKSAACQFSSTRGVVVETMFKLLVLDVAPLATLAQP
jgi:hypothetical protein